MSDGMLWHIRLGHASLGYLKQLKKQKEFLKEVIFDDAIQKCEVCALANLTKQPFKEVRSKAERPLERIHSDIMGPISPKSYPGNNSFIIIFLDDFSRYAKLYSIKQKSEAGDCLEKFIQHSRNILGKEEKVCYIRADNALEYKGGKFQDIMEKEKAEEDFAPTYTPELNGTSERFNRTIQNKIRAMMIDSGLPDSMWILAAEAAVHVYNRTPHKSINFEIPLERFTHKKKLHIDKIKRFGCIAYVKIPITKTKFSPRAIKAILVGYSTTGYVLWHPPTRKFLDSKHVKFNEKIVYKDLSVVSTINENLEDQTDEMEKEQSNTIITFSNNEKKEVNLEEKPNKGEKVKPKRRRPPKHKIDQSEIQTEVPITATREQPKRKAKEGRDFKIYANKIDSKMAIEDVSFADFAAANMNLQDKIHFKDAHTECTSVQNSEEDEVIFALLASINNDPVTYQEAVTSKEKLEWQKAIYEELKSMKENDVWDIVEKPVSEIQGTKINIIDSKWVFKRKTEKGVPIYKARLVIRGFKDRKEYELKETYAPVSRLPVVRSVLALINKYDLNVCQMDVKTAFLNGTLEDNIYMKIPDGLDLDEQNRKNKVCKLKKSLYGLKISPKRWNIRFSEEALKLGLEKDVNEPCLFTWRKHGRMALIVLYVDDMLIASNDLEKLNEIKIKLGQAFNMKDLGEPENFLGMKISRDRKKKIMKINQLEYTQNILKRFNMNECRTHETPMITRQVKNKSQNTKICENTSSEKIPYREAIGSLLYLAGTTRPDIAYAVNILSRKQMNPTIEDWTEVKRVFRYLKGTADLGLVYKAKTDTLEALTDASFRDWNDSTSTSGYIITLFGDSVSWRSHKQNYVTLSTCQAEYLAMSEACQELISLDKAIRDITGKTMYPFTIRCDNKSAGDCTEMDGSKKMKNFDDSLELILEYLNYRENTGTKKHMADTHGDYVKYLVLEDKVKVRWISTEENSADIMTKPLERIKHKRFTKNILNLD